MFEGSPLQHTCAGFAAGTIIAGNVGAIIQAIDKGSGGGELFHHQSVNFVHQRFGVIAASDSGLVGDDEDRQSAIVEFANCGGREWEHAKAGNVIYVTDFLGDGAVAIEENGAAMGGLRHVPPSRRTARDRRRLPPLPA